MVLPIQKKINDIFMIKYLKMVKDVFDQFNQKKIEGVEKYTLREGW